MTQRIAETKFYPKEPSVEVDALSDTSTVHHDSPPQFQTSKASRVGEHQVMPTRLYKEDGTGPIHKKSTSQGQEAKSVDVKAEPNSATTDQQHPIWYNLFQDDSTDDEVADDCKGLKHRSQQRKI